MLAMFAPVIPKVLLQDCQHSSISWLFGRDGPCWQGILATANILSVSQTSPRAEPEMTLSIYYRRAKEAILTKMGAKPPDSLMCACALLAQMLGKKVRQGRYNKCRLRYPLAVRKPNELQMQVAFHGNTNPDWVGKEPVHGARVDLATLPIFRVPAVILRAGCLMRWH